MRAANQNLFDDPREYDRHKAAASGFSGGRARGGIAFITEDKVRPGEILYRIGHSNMPMTVNMSSPWWMREDTFEHIMGCADRAGSDPQQLFRMKCAVACDFGVADVILMAQVKQTLRAFTGRGYPVWDESDEKKGQLWLGGMEIAQLFIPGLRDFARKIPTPLCHASLEILEKFKVSEYIHVQRRRNKWLRKQVFAGNV